MSDQNDSQNPKNNMLVVLGVGLVLGFAVGHFYTKSNMLEKGSGQAAAGTQQVAGAQDPAAQQPEPAKDLKIVKPDATKDHWKGPEGAEFVHVEYSDFECPFCQKYSQETTGKIFEEFGDKLAMVHRQFPLSFHPKAQKSAEASECVADLGGNEAFWKFHDDLFAAMPAIELTGLPDLAAKAGVSASAVKECMDSDKFAQKVTDQMNEGTKAGVGATPTSVIYNMKTGKSVSIEGALPFESVKQTIEDFMKS